MAGFRPTSDARSSVLENTTLGTRSFTEPDGDSLAWARPHLTALVNEFGCTLVFEEHRTDLSGFFALATKVISVNSAHAVNHQVKTLVHELAHCAALRHGPRRP